MSAHVSPFHIRRPTTANARSPNVVLVRGVASLIVMLTDDRRRTASDVHNAVIAILWRVVMQTGSQCKSRILYQLKVPKLAVGDAIEKTVAVVKPAAQ